MFFPLVGLIIGGLQWVIYWLLIKLLPVNITVVFVMLTGILITGGLHIDGLGDTCDGFFSFKSKERIIEIMKDSRVGTYSCIAIIIDLLLRYSAYSNLILGGYSLAIIAAPLVARTVYILIFYIGKQAKASGTGNLFIANVGKKELAAAFLLGLIINSFLLGAAEAIILVVIAVIITVLFNKFCENKIGGLTGDTLGANNELIEISALILSFALRM